jgi:hypothetical protein
MGLGCGLVSHAEAWLMSLCCAGPLRPGCTPLHSCLRLSRESPHACLWPPHSRVACAHNHLAPPGPVITATALTCPQGFRTVDGTGSAPMPLDPLTRLSRLVALDLEYTGEGFEAVVCWEAVRLEGRERVSNWGLGCAHGGPFVARYGIQARRWLLGIFLQW